VSESRESLEAAIAHMEWMVDATFQDRHLVFTRSGNRRVLRSFIDGLRVLREEQARRADEAIDRDYPHSGGP
jgi:hypothetical protein